jgi:hypothetical protein
MPRFPGVLLDVLLRLYPSDFRRAKGREVAALYRAMWRERTRRGIIGATGFGVRMVADLGWNAFRVWGRRLVGGRAGLSSAWPFGVW